MRKQVYKSPLNLNFPVDILTSFKQACDKKGVTLTQEIESMMISFVSNDTTSDTLSFEQKLQNMSILSSFTQWKELFSEVQDKEHFDQLMDSVINVRKALNDQWSRISELEFRKPVNSPESIEVVSQ